MADISIVSVNKDARRGQSGWYQVSWPVYMLTICFFLEVGRRR